MGLQLGTEFQQVPHKVTKSTHTADYHEMVRILRQTRKKAHLTQQDVAKRLGKPQSYISKIEGAERRIDPIEFVHLAQAMEVDPHALLHSVLAVMNVRNS